MFYEKPSLVITDSQVFGRVSADTPDDIRLTSFSILMARHKGLLESAVRGVTAVDKLKDGDKVLIAEGVRTTANATISGRSRFRAG